MNNVITQDNFRTEVLEYRIRNKITQEKFAEKAGIHRLTVVGIESGKIEKLNSMTLYKINKYISKLS